MKSWTLILHMDIRILTEGPAGNYRIPLTKENSLQSGEISSINNNALERNSKSDRKN